MTALEPAPADTSWVTFTSVGKKPDPWLDPYLIDCGCRRCQGGRICPEMKTLRDEYDADQTYRAKAHALTAEDRLWLESQGWECPAPPHRSPAA